MNNPFNVEAPSYPNGRTFELKDPVDRGSYKYLFYDPSTHTEALYRKSFSRIKIPFVKIFYFFRHKIGLFFLVTIYKYFFVL